MKKNDLNYIKYMMKLHSKSYGSCEACPVSIYISNEVNINKRNIAFDNCYERILFTLEELKITNKKVPENVAPTIRGARRGVKCQKLYDWFLNINERTCRI